MLGPVTERVCAFLSSLQTTSGGFVGRKGKPDVYYACFASAALSALGGDWRRPALADWLRNNLPAVDDAAQFASWLRCRALLMPEQTIPLPLGLRRQLLGCAAGCAARKRPLDPQQAFLAASAAGALGQELPERSQLTGRLQTWLDEHPGTATGQLAAAA
ncbi:MAG: hypothetical protein ACOCXJ_07030, partial [Planctomycetota bacterium]